MSNRQFKTLDQFVEDIKNDISKMTTDDPKVMIKLQRNITFINEQYIILRSKFNSKELSKQSYLERIEEIGCDVYENYVLSE